MAALVPAILKDHARISILINCAGVQKRHPAHEFPTEDWDCVLQTNLSSVFVLCREVGAHMLSQTPDADGRRGVIINLASLLSFQGGFTVAAYAASKGGIAQLTKALSNEWAKHGINVNAIAPGYVATDMNTALMEDEERAASILARIPQGRWRVLEPALHARIDFGADNLSRGKPDDFKGPVVFLASAASSYVNGEVFCVDGGWMGR